jgi:hypothetical protein
MTQLTINAIVGQSSVEITLAEGAQLRDVVNAALKAVGSTLTIVNGDHLTEDVFVRDSEGFRQTRDANLEVEDESNVVINQRHSNG